MKVTIKTLQTFFDTKTGEVLMPDMAFAYEVVQIPEGIDWRSADDATVLKCAQIAMITNVNKMIKEGAAFPKLEGHPNWGLKGIILQRLFEG